MLRFATGLQPASYRRVGAEVVLVDAIDEGHVKGHSHCSEQATQQRAALLQFPQRVTVRAILAQPREEACDGVRLARFGATIGVGIGVRVHGHDLVALGHACQKHM